MMSRKEHISCERQLSEGHYYLKAKLCYKGRTVISKIIINADGETEKEFIDKGITLLLTCLMEHENADIPESLPNIPAEHVINLLEQLREKHNWKVVTKLIQMRKEWDKNRLEEFTRRIDIDKIIKCPKFSKEHTMLKDILKDLFEIGVKIKDDGKTSIDAAKLGKHYQLIPLLLENGANCEDFSLSEGDTPMHAAVSLGLKTGKFDVFEFLLEKVENKDPRYAVCNLNAMDVNGNGLFHIVMAEEDNIRTRKALKLLIRHGASTMCLPNKKGISPIEMARKSDSRCQIMAPCLPPRRFKNKRRTRSRKTRR